MTAQTERIARYEQILDRAEEAARRTEDALEEYGAVQGDLRELEKYYTGPEWKADFEADEQGLLPAGMKRGVLSEDGIDLVLDRFRELRCRMIQLCGRTPEKENGRRQEE